MSHPKNKSRFARIVGRLVRCESGGSDIIAGLLMTGLGIMAVSQTIQPMKDATNTAGDALKRQAGVLARGSDTGSTNGGSGGSGFDFGSTLGAVEGVVGQVGSVAGQFANQNGQNGRNGTAQNVGAGTQGGGVTGSVKP